MDQNQLSNLKAKLYANSSLNGKSNDEIASILSTPIITIVHPCLHTSKTLVRDITDTVAAFTLINTISQLAQDPIQKSTFFWIDKWLNDGTGIDIGLQKTRDMIDQFVAENVLTLAQGAAVKALAETSTFPQGGPSTTADVALALASNSADSAAESLGNDLSLKIQQRLNDYRTAIASGQTASMPTVTDLIA